MTNREYLLLPYQQRYFHDDSNFIVWSKSRRIGASYAVACKAVMRAAQGTHNTYYLSTRAEAGTVFIADCVEWAQRFQIALSRTTELIRDFDPATGTSSDILAYSIRFASGTVIQALTSSPKNLRGLKGPGVVVCDEAAFAPDLDQLLKAANAFLIWGGKVVVLSTHDGVGNAFNTLCRDVQAGKCPGYSYHHTPFRLAVAEGLYRRICLTSGQPWSQASEDTWITQIYAQYGRGAAEELDAVPDTGGAGFFTRDWFTFVDSPFAPAEIKSSARAYDLAATAPSSKNKAPDWSAGIRGHLLRDNRLYLDDVIRIQASPSTLRARIRSTAEIDTPAVAQAFWEDPGAAGKFQSDDIANLLIGFNTRFERAAKSKEIYAAPVSSMAEQGKLVLLRAPWNEALINELCAFPGGANDDQVDALSRLHMALTQAPWSFGYSAAPDPRHAGPAGGKRDIWYSHDDYADSGTTAGKGHGSYL